MNSTDRSTDNSSPVLDLTGTDTAAGTGPAIDLRDNADLRDTGDPPARAKHANRQGYEDVDLLAEILISREIPEAAAIDLTVGDLTAVHDRDAEGISERGGHSWGQSAPRDKTVVGSLITPRTAATARRLFHMTREGRPLVNSPGTFYPSHRRFSADYVHRNLNTLVTHHSTETAEHIYDTGGPVGHPIDSDELQHAAQYRLEYFVALPAEEFNFCFRYNGEITREYLLHAERSDRLFAERQRPAATTAPADRRSRKAEAVKDL